MALRQFNYSKVRGKIKEVFGTESAFANALGISNQKLSMIFNHKAEFSLANIKDAVILLDIEPEDIYMYFFSEED